MSSSRQNNSPFTLDPAREVPIPLGGIVCIWCGVAWCVFMMGTFQILAGVPENRPTPFGTGLEIAGGVICILFALAWGAVAYYAFQRQPWAIRTGFGFSLICAAVIVCAMFWETAIAGEWSVLGAILVVMISIGWLRNQESKNRPVVFALIVSCIGFMIYWSNSSENSEAVRAAARSWPMLACMASLFWPYLKSCRALWTNPPLSNSSVGASD